MLRRYRKRAGLSQEALAGDAGVSVESIGALERGVRRAPHRDTVGALAIVLGLDETERAAFEETAERARARGTGPTLSSEPGPGRRLPSQATSLVGRGADVEAILALLGGARLVTVTGPGGVGKTRVALEAAGRSIRDGRTPYFVDLGSQADGVAAAGALAASFDAGFGDGGATLEALVAVLGSREALFVLDNCERVVADVAHVVSTVLRACPRIAFLATSRERLAVGGEAVYRLPGLETPNEVPATVREARRYDALDLFFERATAYDRTFVPTEASLEHAVDICRRLDGIPLALELAAARVATLGLSELRKRLHDGLDLSGGPRNLPARQRAISATIAWSYDLLGERERALLHAFAAFPDEFSLADACAASAPRFDAQAVTAALTSLVDKSLLGVVLADGVARYRMLRSLRAFALERAKAAGRADAIL